VGDGIGVDERPVYFSANKNRSEDTQIPQVTWAYFVDSITPSQKLAINIYSDNSYPVNTPCTPPGHPL
jgi:hypothetical protein